MAIPLSLGVALGHASLAVLALFGTLNLAMADPGGARRGRWRELSVATAVDALALALGTLVGTHVWLALTTLAVVAFVCGMLCLFGPRIAVLGLTTSILFVVGVGFSGPSSSPLQALWAAALGGVWGMVVLLVVHPGPRLLSARRAVAGCFGSLRDLLMAVSRYRRDPGAGRVDSITIADAVRHRLVVARSTIESTRPRTEAERLLIARWRVSTDRVPGLLKEVEGLCGLVADVEGAPIPPASWAPVEDALVALAEVVGALGGTGDDRGRGGTDRLGGLKACTQSLERSIEDLRHRGGDGLRAVAVLRPICEGLERVAAGLAGLDGTLDSGTLAGQGAIGLAGEGRTVARHRWSGYRSVAAVDTARVAASWRTARANLTVDSNVFRRSARFAVTAVAGLVLGHLLHLDKPYWVTVTIAAILQPYAAISFRRALLRVVGTVAGALLAVAMVFSVHANAGLVVFVALMSFFMFTLIALNYALGVVGLTAVVLLLCSVGHPGDWHLALTRVAGTLVGAGLVLLSAPLFWPGRERRSIDHELGAAIDAVRLHLGVVLACCVASSGPDNPGQVARLHERAALALDNAQTGLDRFLGDWQAARGSVSVLWSMTDVLRSIFLDTTAIENHLASMFRKDEPPQWAEVCQNVDEALRALSEAMITGRPLPAGSTGAGTTRRAMTAFCQQVEQLRADRSAEIAAGNDEVTDLAKASRDRGLIDASLRRICDGIDQIGDDVCALAGRSTGASVAAA